MYENDVVKALLGKTITSVEVSQDRQEIRVETTAGPVRLQTGAD